MTNSIGDSLGFLLGLVARQCRTDVDRALKEHGLTDAQFWLLMLLTYEKTRSGRRLAEALDKDPTAVTRLIDRLEQKGFVSRLNDPTDRRSINLALTNTAKTLMTKLIRLNENAEEKFFQPLTDDEKSTFLELLRKLHPETPSALKVTDRSAADE